MKIYLDYLFIINFLFDFILLLGISIILKRNITKKRLLLGSLIGGLSFFIILLNISEILLFILKMFLGIIMTIITFSYKEIKYTITNFIYLIILSIFLGGALYKINISIGYDHIGILFFTNGKSLNLMILILLSIIIIITYSKYITKTKKNINNFFKVDITNKNKTYKLNGFLDTGNELYYFNKPCLIINKDIKINKKEKIYIPFKTISGSGIMKGFIVEKIHIENHGYFYNVPIAISNDKFNLHGTDIILNINLMEEKNDNKTNKNKINKKTIKEK